MHAPGQQAGWPVLLHQVVIKFNGTGLGGVISQVR